MYIFFVKLGLGKLRKLYEIKKEITRNFDYQNL